MSITGKQFIAEAVVTDLGLEWGEPGLWRFALADVTIDAPGATQNDAAIQAEQAFDAQYGSQA